MSFQKFGDKEKITPLEDKEVEIIKEHESKVGKSIRDFTEEERENLREKLNG